MKSNYIPLSNEKVSLEPLTAIHIDDLKAVCISSEIWRWFTVDLSAPSAMAKWMNGLLEESERGDKMTYAIRLVETNQVIGATSYGHIDWKEKGIEVGWTWIGADFIGSGINKNMKFLMLRHAFETMGIERLELRTDEVNIRSRKAMEKIGAQHDGTLRSHRYNKEGGRRNSVIYSIIKPEWANIKATIFKEF